MAIDDLYEADFLLWTERQAAELRGLAKSRRDLPNALDLEHVAEEIEDLGRSELNAVRSLIRNILLHLLKCATDPQARAVAHWKAEIRAFQDDLSAQFARSMGQRIDIDALWRRAVDLARGEAIALDQPEGPNPPEACPFCVEDLVEVDFDLEELLGRLLPRN